MIQLAFLGVAHIHTPWFLNVIKARPDLKIKSVWDHDPARGQKRADEAGAAFMADYKDILKDKEIGAVIVCSETNRHEELAIASARKKKHTFVEKPLGMGAKDAGKIAKAFEKAGVIFQTGYGSRGSNVLSFLKQEIAAGAFGKVTRVRGSNCHNGALGGWFDTEWRWMADPAVAGCGAFGDLGTHALDILLWWMGEVESATGALGTGTARYGNCDETGEGLLRFKNGAIGTLASAWDDWDNPLSYLITGTQAHAAVIHGKLHYHRHQQADALQKQIKDLEPALTAADKSEEEKKAVGEQIAQLKAKLEVESGRQPWTELPPGKPAGIEAFLAAITGQGADLVPVREAAYASAVMEAILKGAAAKKWVAPKV